MVYQLKSITDQQPCNIEVEENILGSILLDPNAIARVAAIIEPEAFFVKVHAHIYKVALKLFRSNKPVDLMSVTIALDNSSLLAAVGGTAKLASLLNRTVSAVNVDRFAQLIKADYLKRQAIEYANNIISLAYDKTVDTGHYYQELKELTAKLQSCEDLLNGEDPDRAFANRIVAQVREVELKVLEPHVKYFKMHKLANQYGVTSHFLENLYFKSLVADQYEQSCSFDEFSAKYGNEVREWMLHGFIPKGTTILLHALGGVGKTMLAYYLVSLLATGKPWNNFQVTAPYRNAIIFQTDESRGDSIDKASNLFRGVPRVKISSRWTVDHLPQLRKEIEDHKAEIVIIDSLSSISRNSLYSENDTQYARPILMLRDIAQELGCTVIIIHHSSKAGQSRGSSAIFNSVSEVWNLSRPSEGSKANCTERILSIEKSRSRRPEDCLLKFEPETGEWLYLGKKDDNDARLASKDKIVDFLSKNRNKRFDTKSLHELLLEPFNTIRSDCYQLYEEGLISRVRIAGEKAYSYFLALEQMNQSSDPSDPIEQKTNNRITSRITPWITCFSSPESHEGQSLEPSLNSASDPTIDEKPLFSDRDKNTFFVDHRITCPQKTAEPIDMEEPQQVIQQVIQHTEEIDPSFTETIDEQESQQVIQQLIQQKKEVIKFGSLAYDSSKEIDWVRYQGEVYKVSIQRGKKLSLRQYGMRQILHQVYVHQVEIGGYRDKKEK
jgi:replicative DNA helicase